MSQNLLSAENHAQGLLVSDALCGGVVPLDTGKFAAFVTEIDTAVPVDYEEFLTLNEAIDHMNRRAASGGWHFEAFGCTKGASCKGAQKGACEGCSNNVNACC